MIADCGGVFNERRACEVELLGRGSGGKRGETKKEGEAASNYSINLAGLRPILPGSPHRIEFWGARGFAAVAREQATVTVGDSRRDIKRSRFGRSTWSENGGFACARRDRGICRTGRCWPHSYRYFRYFLLRSRGDVESIRPCRSLVDEGGSGRGKACEVIFWTGTWTV
jgi:hypothetical protein